MAGKPEPFRLKPLAQLVIIGDMAVMGHGDVGKRTPPERLGMGRVNLRLRRQPQMGDPVRADQRANRAVQPVGHADRLLDGQRRAHAGNRRTRQPGFNGADKLKVRCDWITQSRLHGSGEAHRLRAEAAQTPAAECKQRLRLRQRGGFRQHDLKTQAGALPAEDRHARRVAPPVLQAGRHRQQRPPNRSWRLFVTFMQNPGDTAHKVPPEQIRQKQKNAFSVCRARARMQKEKTSSPLSPASRCRPPLA